MNFFEYVGINVLHFKLKGIEGKHRGRKKNFNTKG